jgi:two-component system, OmpR family, heavy metal sensor histidine kinase CusS
VRRLLGHSLTLRLTLLFAGVSTSVLLLLGLLVGALVERHFEELDLELLNGKLELVQRALEQVRAAPDLARLPAQLRQALVGHHGLEVVVLGGTGEVWFATEGANFPAALLRPDKGVKDSPSSVWQDAAGLRFRGVAARAPTGIATARPAVVGVATDMAHHEHFMRSFQNALWSVVGLAALLSGALGWGAARKGLAPLRDIRRRVADITAERLDQRLAVAAIPAELAEVAATLNAMLARLQESFTRLSDFSSDLAHELRSPVSNLLIQTQVTLSKARTAQQYQEVLVSNAEEFERLSRIIADMLFLAKSDNHLMVPNREPVELRREVLALFDFYEALAEEKNLTLRCAGAATVAGDRLMLRRALGNLLSNAVRHTPDGGVVAVGIEADADAGVTVSVSNSGATIAPEHLPRLFDRFYRADASRRQHSEGAGLGLAIVASIAQAHGAAATVRSAYGQTTFELRLPPSQAVVPADMTEM